MILSQNECENVNWMYDTLKKHRLLVEDVKEDAKKAEDGGKKDDLSLFENTIIDLFQRTKKLIELLSDVLHLRNPGKIAEEKEVPLRIGVAFRGQNKVV